MEISTGILFAIVAMLGWGFADFFVAIAVRRAGIFRPYLWATLLTASLSLPIFLAFFGFPAITLETIGMIFLTGLLSVTSYLCFFKGLEIGKVSVILPIASSWPLLTAILGILFLGETLTALQATAVGFIIFGGILVSFKLKDIVKLKFGNPFRGVRYAVISFFGWGIHFIFIGVLVSRIGWFLPVLFTKIAAVLYLLAYARATKRNISFPRNIAPFVILMGVLEVIAFSSYGLGITSEYTAVVAPIISASPMITIFLARIFFRETLEINQKIGVVSVLAGLVLLAM